MKNKTIGWISDLHYPYQDIVAIKTAMSVFKMAKVDEIIVGGDLLDMYSLSRFDKDPARKQSVKYEIEQGKLFLKRLRRDFPKAKIIYLEGNHEFRLRRWIQQSELHDFEQIQLENLLDLDKLGIDFYEYNDPYWITDHFIATHGSVIRAKSGYTAHGELLKNSVSGISGHVHRCGLVFDTRLGVDYFWVEGGCVCSLNPDYMSNPNWQQGVVILEVKSGEVHPELVPFREHGTYFRGKKA